MTSESLHNHKIISHNMSMSNTNSLPTLKNCPLISNDLCITKVRFHKLIYALHQTICTLRPTFEKLFNGAKVWRKAPKIGIGHKTVNEIDPRRERDVQKSVRPFFLLSKCSPCVLRLFLYTEGNTLKLLLCFNVLLCSK